MPTVCHPIVIDLTSEPDDARVIIQATTTSASPENTPVHFIREELRHWIPQMNLEQPPSVTTSCDKTNVVTTKYTTFIAPKTRRVEVITIE